MTGEKDIFERLKRGEIIPQGDSQRNRMRDASYETKKILMKLNSTADASEIRNYLGEIIGSEIDETTTVFTPLYINYGKDIKIGRNVFINFDCVFLGLGGITIEDHVLIAPKVSILSEGHPVESELRHSLVPGRICIKRNAWIGAGATILPGVTVGENSVVASGAVVSKDVPDNTVVAGIPAKVVKHL